MSERAVRLELPNCAGTQGVAVTVERTLAGRVARATIMLGALWGAALLCVFIPLLHFVLVPTLLLLGPVLAFARVREAVSLRAVRGACPRCQVERTFPGSGRFRDGCGLHCDGCGNDIALRTEPAGATAPLG